MSRPPEERRDDVVAPVNYRDVGELLGLWLDPSPMPTGHLLRGGKLDALTKPIDIGGARTVINLRRGPDPSHLPDTDLVHLPAKDDVENYDTSRREGAVRADIERALDGLEAHIGALRVDRVAHARALGVTR